MNIIAYSDHYSLHIYDMVSRHYLLIVDGWMDFIRLSNLAEPIFHADTVIYYLQIMYIFSYVILFLAVTFMIFVC